MNNFHKTGEQSIFEVEQNALGDGSHNIRSSSELALNSYKTVTLADEHVRNLSVDELEKSLHCVRLSTGAVVKTSRSPSGSMHFLLHGDPETIRKTEKAICWNVSKKVTMSFEIPSRARGIVVGKRGSKIRGIKRQCNVNITIERRRLHRCMKISDYHKVDQLRLVHEDPCVACKVQFNPSVKVTIEGTASSCDAAKASILELAGDSVEEVFHIPCELFFVKARNLVKESFEAVSVRNSVLEDLNLMVVQGPRAAVNAAVECFNSIKERFHVTIAIPTALKHRIIDDHFSNSDIISQGSFNGDSDEWHEIWGEESIILRIRQEIIQFTSTFSRLRLTLADLHDGDVAHVRAILSLDEVKSAFDEFTHKSGCERVLTAYPYHIINEVQFIDFYGRYRENVEREVTKLKTLIQSVSPNDLLFIHDESLSRKLSMFTSGDTLEELPDRSVKCRVMRDSLVIYRSQEGKILHSDSGDIDEAIKRGLEDIKRIAESTIVAVLEVPSMSQPILRVKHLSDITPGVSISFYKNGLQEDKDKITLCGNHESVARARNLIREVLECKKYPSYTQVIEMPTFFANVIKIQSVNRDEKYKSPFGISLHVSRKNGLQTTQRTTVSDMSLVTLTGNKFYVEASKKTIEDDLGEFRKFMFTLSTEIDERFLMRVIGRNFRHIKHLEKVHKVKIALPEEHPIYPYLFRSSESENTLDQINISGASEKSVLDAKDELMRIFDSKKKNTETTTLRIPQQLVQFLYKLEKCKRPGICLGVDFIFHDRGREFDDVDILGCSPDFEGAVEWFKYLVGQDTSGDNEEALVV